MAGILDLSLRDLWDDERITLVKRLQPLLEVIPLDQDAFLPEIITAISSSSEELSLAMTRVQASKITALMKIEDDTRDDEIDMIHHAITFFGKKKDEILKEASEKLKEKYDNAFGGVSLSNNTLETNRIDIFITDCQDSETQNVIEILGLKNEIATLKLSNSNYESLRKERASLKESDETPLLSPSRRALNRNISFLENYLDFKVSQESIVHSSLVEEITVPISEVMAVARARKTREENSAS